jgi:hypothetical protein
MIEHQPPGRACDDRRDDDRQQQDGDERLPQRHAVDEQDCQEKPEDKLNRQGDGGERDGAQDGPPQPGIVEQALVVDEPVEAAVVGEHVDVLEAGQQQLDEGIEPDQQDEEDRRRDDRVFEETILGQHCGCFSRW